MNVQTWLDLVQWAIPAGGIGAAIAWVANRKLIRIKLSKTEHDTFHQMYDDVSALLEKTQTKYNEMTETLEDLRNDRNKISNQMADLREAVRRIADCKYLPACPVNEWMQNHPNRTRKLLGDKDRHDAAHLPRDKLRAR
jgi:hypothetical protein